MDRRPRQDGRVRPLLRRFSPVYQYYVRWSACWQGWANLAHCVQHVGGNRGPALGLDKRQGLAGGDHEVGLGTVSIAVVEEAGWFAAMDPLLEDLGRHPRFEDRPPQRMRVQVIRGPNPSSQQTRPVS